MFSKNIVTKLTLVKLPAKYVFVYRAASKYSLISMAKEIENNQK
jgi:hypothetical protein